MTPDELDRWSTKLMGWIEGTDFTIEKYGPEGQFTGIWISSPNPPIAEVIWHPSDPATGQIWLVVEKMRELGYVFSLDWGHESIPGCSNMCRARFLRLEDKFRASDDPDPCAAILKAANAAVESSQNPTPQPPQTGPGSGN